MDVTELIWNLKRLIRDGFPKGLPLAEFQPQYSKYFQCDRFPTPDSIEPGCKDWSQVFKKSPKFKEWFRLDNRKLIKVLPLAERDLKAYFRLVRYTQYLMARQGAKIDKWSDLSESSDTDSELELGDENDDDEDVVRDKKIDDDHDVVVLSSGSDTGDTDSEEDLSVTASRQPRRLDSRLSLDVAPAPPVKIAKADDDVNTKLNTVIAAITEGTRKAPTLRTIPLPSVLPVPPPKNPVRGTATTAQCAQIARPSTSTSAAPISVLVTRDPHVQSPTKKATPVARTPAGITPGQYFPTSQTQSTSSQFPPGASGANLFYEQMERPFVSVPPVPPVATVYPQVQSVQSQPPFYPVQGQYSQMQTPSRDMILAELRQLYLPFNCRVCKAVLQTMATRIAHYNGKRHKENLRAWLDLHRASNFRPEDLSWAIVKCPKLQDKQLRWLRLLNEAVRLAHSEILDLDKLFPNIQPGLAKNLRLNISDMRRNLLDGFCVFDSDFLLVRDVLNFLKRIDINEGAPGYADIQQLKSDLNIEESSILNSAIEGSRNIPRT